MPTFEVEAEVSMLVVADNDEEAVSFVRDDLSEVTPIENVNIVAVKEITKNG